jgi:hypothetical protein
MRRRETHPNVLKLLKETSMTEPVILEIFSDYV